MQTLEPSARVPVCSCGAVNQTNPAKREQGTGTEPGNSTGKHSTMAENYSNSVLIEESEWGEGVKKGQAQQFSIIKRMVVYYCRNQGRVSLSPIILDLDNEKSEQRRRVGTVHILHSAAPGCPRLKVARHLCHFGPGIVWAGGQGQGNICITSEGLAVCPHNKSLSQSNP